MALGDVAETGGPKMGRAGAFQAEIVCQNLVAMIYNQQARAIYDPNEAEGAIKLTLGKVSSGDAPLNSRSAGLTCKPLGRALYVRKDV
jgi:hypothetical protein